MPKRTLTINNRHITLDARLDRLDLRDFPYRPPVVELPPRFPEDGVITQLLPAYLKTGLILDQGTEGACTGFGLAAVINYLLWRRSLDRKFQRQKESIYPPMTRNNRVSPRMLYHLARFYDEWQGQDYDGSSCRGALKGWHKHGVCRETLWPYDPERFIEPSDGWDKDAVTRPLGVYYRIDRNAVVDLQAAIFQTGAVYVSAAVHSGWDIQTRKDGLSHDRLPAVEPRKISTGGHAFALVGYNERGFVVQNSWGSDWGASGFAVLPYEEWVTHGSDAWVVALGVPAIAIKHHPQDRIAASPKYYVHAPVAAPAGDGFYPIGLPGWLRWLGEDDPLADKPHAWSQYQAHRHTLVTGNDGFLLNRLPQVENEYRAAEVVCHDQPKAWFQANGRGQKHLVIYAHGGLNAEQDSINRVRMMGPCFQENSIYPIFLTWKSGWLETFGYWLTDPARSLLEKLFGTEALRAGGPGEWLGSLRESVVEAFDRSLEIAARNLGARSLWQEMKENVERSVDTGRGIDTLAKQLTNLARDLEGDLRLHLIGHSAGAFVCGRLLTEFQVRDVKVASCTLFAPACDIRFALNHYQPAIENGILAQDKLFIHVLSDAREQADNVRPYQKSLLYLISRALEKHHKTPLLGLANAFDGERAAVEYWHADRVNEVSEWQAFFWGHKVPKKFAHDGRPNPKGNLFILNKNKIRTGLKDIPSSHGCFDNSIDLLEGVIRNILNLKKKESLAFKISDLGY